MTIQERNALVLSVLPWAVDVVNKRAGGRPDREDVLQDAFVRLVRAAPKYDGTRAAPTTWAAVVLASFLSHRLKRAFFRTPPPSPNATPVEETRDERAVDPADALARREAVERSRLALAVCRPADRAMVEAHVLDGGSIADLDRGVSREACSQRYRKAVNRCRAAFAAVGLD